MRAVDVLELPVMAKSGSHSASDRLPLYPQQETFKRKKIYSGAIRCTLLCR